MIWNWGGALLILLEGKPAWLQDHPSPPRFLFARPGGLPFSPL